MNANARPEPPFVPYFDVTSETNSYENSRDLLVYESETTAFPFLGESTAPRPALLTDLNEEEISRWTSRFPVLKWVEATTRRSSPFPDAQEYGQPAHFVLKLPHQDYLNQADPLFAVLGDGGFWKVTRLDEEGITCYLADETRFIPARPTEQQLRRALVHVLGQYGGHDEDGEWIPDEARQARFLNHHFYGYPASPRAFVEYIRSIAVDEALFDVGRKQRVREFIFGWLKNHSIDEFFPVDSAPTKKATSGRPQPIQRPLAISLYYRVRVGECPYFDEGRKKKCFEFAQTKKVSGQNFYKTYLEIENDTDRLSEPEHIRLALRHLDDNPAAQQLAQTDIKEAEKKKVTHR